MQSPEVEASQALKSIARNLSLKSYVQHSPDLYGALWPAARRFVSGETRQHGIAVASELAARGYNISLEYIGENTTDRQGCEVALEEFLALHRAMEAASLPEGKTISLDLSHIGLSVSQQLAVEHLRRLAEETRVRGTFIMIGMEESDKLTAIMEVYKEVVQQYTHIGITLQAHLVRTDSDLATLLQLPGKIRLVKGAYQEPAERALSRGEVLDERYLALAAMLIEAPHPLSIATHDEHLLRQIIERGDARTSHVEIEMLYGVRPDLLRRLKGEGYQTRVYLPYGTEWYLYLCHRLAEYPPNIYRALADCVDPTRTSESAGEYL